MRSYIKFILCSFICAGALLSCSKDGKDSAEAVGGNLPTHYIIINDGSFEPVNITAVNGSTFTFVNHSGSAKGIYSSDSIVINKQNIADNSSYIFSKDTTATPAGTPVTIIYRMAGKPSVTGSITITP